MSNWAYHVFRMGALVAAATFSLHGLPDEASAGRGRPGAGAGRPRPQVSREGPAREGSFSRDRSPRYERNQEGPRGDRRAPLQERPRTDPRMEQGREQRREQIQDRRDYSRDRRGDREPGGYYEDDRRARPDEERLERRDDRRQDLREERHEFYADRRAFVRGATYTAAWYDSQSCPDRVVIVDGYSYYECNDSWFGRSYYGGEVIYTVTDPPSGY